LPEIYIVKRAPKIPTTFKSIKKAKKALEPAAMIRIIKLPKESNTEYGSKNCTNYQYEKCKTGILHLNKLVTRN
jgi:hypothetical protein